MKGTILDFDNLEKKGLILANDGNRYIFDYEKDWKNKNKSVIVDTEVDFVIADNFATEIFSLSKNSDLSDKQSHVKNDNIDKSFKKIDFSSIEKEFNNSTAIEKKKKENIKRFLNSLMALPTIYFFIFVLHEAKMDGILTILLFIVFIIAICFSLIFLINIFSAKSLLKEELIQSKYKEQLKIVNYTPTNLKYEVIKMIHVVDKTYNGATSKLVNEAYKLKADAIINCNYQSTTATNVKTDLVTKYVKSEIHVSNILDGTAIRIIE